MTERKPFLLRLPPELLEELNLWAEEEQRSLNAQIQYILLDAVRERPKGEGDGNRLGHNAED